ncbi:MAG: chemotaxis protein CheA [Pisciglobus halotolerans]|nr:chemotaxis protein CheA [Pisciglobus halotolerans]
MDDNSKYLEVFFEETAAHLQVLNDRVLELEEDPTDIDSLDEIFRSAHTLKGMAATMGFNAMAALTHKMENVFDLLKSQTIQADKQTISLIFDCLDTLSAIEEDLQNGEEGERDIGNLLERLNRIAEGTAEEEGEEAEEKQTEWNTNLQSIEAADADVVETASSEGYHAFSLAIKIEETSMMKNARVFLVLSKLEEHGDILYAEPSADVLENEDFGSIFKVLLLTKDDQETICAAAQDNGEIEEVLIQEVTAEDLQEMNQSDEEEKGKDLSQEAGKKEAKKKPKHKSAVSNHSIRVDIQKLDDFLNAVSELLIYRTRLENLTQEHGIFEMREPLDQVARITTELQDLVLKIRLQPVSTIMTSFPRMVRDLGNDLNKSFNLVIEGEDTELDRTVVSELGEPLIHLIRNSADHGIEKAARRKELGKEAAGLIQITAYQEGNRVVLMVKDDGKGIDPKVIKESAERKGIPTEGLTDKELQHLVFHPGFSTAEEVTSISGRGVGMDVVKQKISSLGGTIEILSEVDKGSTFKINLPLTLSIIESLLVKVEQETFAIPLDIIEKVVEVKPDAIVEAYGRSLYIKEKEPIPVVWLNKELDLPRKNAQEYHLVLVQLGEYRYALAVNDLVKQQEIVIKKLGKELGNVKKYLGATVLGNGEIVLILDVTAIANESIGESRGQTV